jgi:hypothetical protein
MMTLLRFRASTTCNLNKDYKFSTYNAVALLMILVQALRASEGEQVSSLISVPTYTIDFFATVNCDAEMS